MYFWNSIRVLRSWYAVLQNRLKFKFHFLNTLSDDYFLLSASASSSEPAEPNAFHLWTQQTEILPMAAGLLTVNRWHLHLLSPCFIKSILIRLSLSRPSLYQRWLHQGEPNQFSWLIYVWMQMRVRVMNSTCTHLGSSQRAAAGFQQSVPLSCFPLVKMSSGVIFASKYIPNHISLCYTLHFKSSNY